MLEAYLGPDTFRDGVRRYIKARAFSNATSADLWNGLTAASGQNVEALASPWITRPGFPIVDVAASCDAAGNRTIALSQKRFLLAGSDPNAAHWNIPLFIRSGTTGTPQTVLLTKDGQTAPAGRCSEPLTVDADAVGFYRASYDAATLAVDRAQFDKLLDGDRIALLDDQWALASSGQAPLGTYLALASSMGTDTDTRAWTQIASSLGTIEESERGTAGHDAFTIYARRVIAPLAAKLGWDPQPNETPGTTQLRAMVLADLGAWGDKPTIAEAKKRFTAFLANHATLTPELQNAVLSIVAINADQATFDQMHALAKTAKNQTEDVRFYGAMMHVADPKLAEQALAIALSNEIPPQAEESRIGFVFALAAYNPQFSWKAFQANADRLLKPVGTFAPLVVAQYVPASYWNAAPLTEIEAWSKARVPAEMAPNLSRGMESARFEVARKTILDDGADAYVKNGLTRDFPGRTPGS
jgi:aminopeptidase N